MSRAASLALLTVLAASAAGARAFAATEDRYGPPPTTSLAVPAALPAYGLLSWSGKAPPPAPAQPAPAMDAMRGFRPNSATPLAAYRTRPQNVLAERNQLERAQPERTQTAALPTSLYAPAALSQQRGYAAAPRPPSAPMPSAPIHQAQVSQSPPHFYSVHRQFGLTPDPIPLPQQFFAGGSADLAAPPPPLPPRPVPGTQAATSPANTAANRAREVELETADSAN